MVQITSGHKKNVSSIKQYFVYMYVKTHTNIKSMTIYVKIVLLSNKFVFCLFSFYIKNDRMKKKMFW